MTPKKHQQFIARSFEQWHGDPAMEAQLCKQASCSSIGLFWSTKRNLATSALHKPTTLAPNCNVAVAACLSFPFALPLPIPSSPKAGLLRVRSQEAGLEGHFLPESSFTNTACPNQVLPNLHGTSKHATWLIDCTVVRHSSES